MRNVFLCLVIPAFLFCSQQLYAQQKRLYIANDDHTDYMWTADEVKYDSFFVQMLNYYLKQIDSTKNNSPDFQTRFICDENMWLKIKRNYKNCHVWLRVYCPV